MCNNSIFGVYIVLLNGTNNKAIFEFLIWFTFFIYCHWQYKTHVHITVQSPNKGQGPFPDFAIFLGGGLPILGKSAMTAEKIEIESSKNRGGTLPIGLLFTPSRSEGPLALITITSIRGLHGNGGVS